MSSGAEGNTELEQKAIGAYEVVRLLGKGGMGEVYEVENVRLGSHHVLKIFTYEKDNPEVKERFQTEGSSSRGFRILGS